MVNNEILLIGAILQKRDLRSAQKEGLLPTHFGLHRERFAYQYLLEYAEENNGDIPTLEIFLQKSGYDEYVEPPSSTSVSTLAKEVIWQSKVRQVELLIPDPDEVKRDPDKVLRRLVTKAREIMVTHGERSAVDLATGFLQAAADVGKSKLTGALPWAWPSIDRAALGLHPGELLSVYGRPGCMKTWFLIAMAIHVMTTRPRSTVLFYTPELSVKRIFQRVLCLLSAIPFEKVRAGNLNEDDKLKIEMYKEQLEDGNAFGVIGNLVVVEPTDMDVNELIRQVDITKPDLILVDSAYYLTVDAALASRETASLARLCRELTLLGKSAGAPVVISIQAKRAKSEATGPGGGDDVAYSDVLSQDSDVLLRLFPFVDEDTDDEKLLVVVRKARDFSLGGFIIDPPPTGRYDERMVLRNAASAEIALAKIGKQGKQARRVTSLDTDGYAAQNDKKDKEDK